MTDPELLSTLERLAQSSMRADSKIIEREIDMMAYRLVKENEEDIFVRKDYMYFYTNKKKRTGK